MPPPPPPPVVLNPFRTPQHHLSHPRNHNNMNHMNGNLNNSSCSVSSSSSSSSSSCKDGTNNIYSRHTKRWMLVLNSWIEHPMFRICYMMGITLLLICLMMVGYEAYQKFSNPITHSTSILMGPSSSMSQFSITDSTADTAVVLPGMVHENDEVIPEKIILPEILYKIPPKVSKMVGISSRSSSSSSNVQHAMVDGHDSGLRNNASSSSSSSSSYQRKIDDDEIDDVEQKGTTTDRMSHVDSSTTKKVATTTTDDNVEQILRPKEVHTKLLLGLATKDYLEAAILDEQEQNDRGFGGDINIISTDETRNGRNDKGVMTTTSSQDHTQQQQQDLDRMVVVLPLRKGDELLKLPRIRSNNNNNNTNNIRSSNDNRNSVDETTTLTTNALPQPLSPPPLQTDTELLLLLSPPERLSLPEELPLIAITHTVSVERSRRLRHSVVAIPTTPSSETNQSQLID